MNSFDTKVIGITGEKIFSKLPFFFSPLREVFEKTFLVRCLHQRLGSRTLETKISEVPADGNEIAQAQVLRLIRVYVVIFPPYQLQATNFFRLPYEPGIVSFRMRLKDMHKDTAISFTLHSEKFLQFIHV